MQVGLRLSSSVVSGFLILSATPIDVIKRVLALSSTALASCWLPLLGCAWFLHQRMLGDFGEGIHEGIWVEVDDAPAGEMRSESEELVGHRVKVVSQAVEVRLY